MEKNLLALATAISAGVPALIWGAPGTGKSSAIMALGKAMGLPVEVVIASIREPADFAGLPVVQAGEVHFAPPAWARRLTQAGEGILFLDEISTAAPAVQAALLRVVLDRAVGDLVLPDKVRIVAAANPPEQAAGGWDLSHPLANRFVHLDWPVDPSAWTEGMLSGWRTPAVPSLPIGWEAGIPASRALVAAFIKARPSLLLVVPKDDEKAGRAWPSPRSWDMAARLLAAGRAGQVGDDVIASLVTGAVGEGAGLEFLAWLREVDLPDPEDVLAAPDNFKIPARGDLAFALLASVISAAVSNLTRDRWMAAWRVLAKAAEQGGRDVAAVAAKTLAANRGNHPLPLKDLQPFVELLKAGGLMQ